MYADAVKWTFHELEISSSLSSFDVCRLKLEVLLERLQQEPTIQFLFRKCCKSCCESFKENSLNCFRRGEIKEKKKLKAFYVNLMPTHVEWQIIKYFKVGKQAEQFPCFQFIMQHQSDV